MLLKAPNYICNQCQLIQVTNLITTLELGDGPKGKVFAEKLEKIGYTEIYLSSAYTSHLILSNFTWIKDSIGKSAQNAFNVLLNI